MKSSEKTKLLFPLILSITFAAGLWLGWLINKPAALTPGEAKLQELFGIINREYVDSVDLDSLIERSLPSILSNLDPHSAYISLEEKNAGPDELEGYFSGVGIQFQIYNDTVCVVEIISGGPAQRVGIMAGDRIVSVNGRNIASVGITNDSVFHYLRGKEGSSVTIGVVRSGASRPLTFKVKRGNIPVTTIDAAYMLDRTTGFVKVNKFGRSTYGEFLDALNKLRGKGAKDYVIDLRGNTGGYMEPAILMVNEFLPEGKLIVQTHGRHEEQDQKVISDGNGDFQKARVIVLIDETSASASEIFSGAIQDNDRGLLLGRRTFGKGLVQRQILLNDSSEIRLTVQRYYTPSGRCIQKKYHPGQNEDYEYEIYERWQNGEMQTADSTKFDTSLMYKTGTGRTVCGGGGIMPDIFMPSDTTGVTGYFVKVFQNGIMQRFAYEYCDLNRPTLVKSKNVDELLRKLPADDILLGSFVYYAAQNGVPARWFYINISRKLIINQLQALIARDILGISAYYIITGRQDPNVLKAVKLMHSGEADFPIK